MSRTDWIAPLAAELERGGASIGLPPAAGLAPARLMTIDADYKVRHYDPTMEDEPYSKADKFLTTALHGSKAKLPAAKKHWPSLACLAVRNRDDGW